MEAESHLCPTCQKSFTRLKHLKRHQLSHENERDFHCDRCSKSFTRKDGLQRHRLTHDNPSASLVRSRGRACLTCVVAKAKCSGVLPCRRCEDKGIACEYPQGQTLSQQASHIDTEAPSEIDEHVPDRASETPNPHTEPPGIAIDMNHDQIRATQMGSANRMGNFDPPRQSSNHLTFSASSHLSSNTYRQDQVPQAEVLSGFDLNGWDPNFSNAINWLQTENASPHYAQMHDLFPMLSSENTFSPTAYANYSIYNVTDFSNSAIEAVAIVPTPTSSHTRSIPTTSPQGSPEDERTSVSTSTDLRLRQDREDGTFYVDGDRARRSRHKRRRLMSFAGHRHQTHFSLALPSTLSYLESPAPIQHVSEQQNTQINTYFGMLCTGTTFFQPFLSPDVVSREALSQLIELYLEHFNPVLPFLHRQSFRGCSRHFAMLLAMAAIGCRFLNNAAGFGLGSSISEFLRRVLHLMGEDRTAIPGSKHELVQTRLLHSISTKYSAFRQSEDMSLSYLRQCTAHIEVGWPLPDGKNAENDVQSQWLSWIKEEELRRTFFCVWLVDCITASHTERPPNLRLSTAAEHELPCIESLWEADTSEAWQKLWSIHGTSTTLQETLQHMYVEKRLSQSLGEFARIIVIHGLYQRTWEVKEYLQQGLSHFEPSAQRQSSESIISPVPIWHPSMELFNKWRNSALDCIDLLHWNANALISLAHGMEHPTVMHLHFSRVVLLSPLRSILQFARFLTGSGSGTSPKSRFEQAENDLHTIQQWVVRDQYKARLAAIHAGSTFWHTRRYSTNAFYEPESLALSTLMLWALSKFTPSKRSTGEVGASEAPMDDVCDIILLDRPTDDELVQQYVRQGHTMHANMTGVGDLFGPAGAQRVLVEGRKLLSTFGAWEEATTFWLQLLSRLETATASSADAGRVGDNRQ